MIWCLLLPAAACGGSGTRPPSFESDSAGTSPTSTPADAWASPSPLPGTGEGDAVTPSAPPSRTPDDVSSEDPTPIASDTPVVDIAPGATSEPTPSPSPPPSSSSTPPPPSPTPSWIAYCPEGMVEIHEGEGSDIAFCISTYEVVVYGDLGSADQYADDAVPTSAYAVSEAGVIPSMGISYDQAVATCAGTEVVDSQGLVVGTMHLATSDEWRDAADGTLGAGGLDYPYGDTFDADACATLNADGEQVYDGLQPTGSFELCVSPFGAFDLSGNAWEWADSQITMSISGWFVLADHAGLSVSLDDADLIRVEDAADADALVVEVNGIQPSDVFAEDDGYLYINDDQLQGTLEVFKGYLKIEKEGIDPNDADNFLPIEVVKEASGSTGTHHRLLLLPEEDGRPVPDKRGCAYYVGGAYDCSTYSSHLVHFHDFDGTIGFRCVCDPIVESLLE